MNCVHINQVSDNAHETNKTMRLLGHQRPLDIFTSNVRKQMDDIVKAYPYRTTTLETAMYMVMLGYIYGKRAERARRKARAVS